MPKDDNQGTPVWNDLKRKRGILTTSDREYLSDPKEYDEQASRDKRYRIRERVKNSLYDFNDLLLMPANDRKRVFNTAGEEGGPTLVSALGFFYMGITKMAEQSGETGIELFETLLSNAIESREMQELEYIANVNVDIEIEREQPDSDEMKNKILSGTATLNEFMYHIDNHEAGKASIRRLAELEEPLTIMTSDGSEAEIMDVEEIQELSSRFGKGSG